MSDWQSIEAAPKDGSTIIVACPAVGAARWSTFKDPCGYWEWFSGGRCHPTFWMPMPDAPSSYSETTLVDELRASLAACSSAAMKHGAEILALRSCLSDIYREYQQTYSGEIHPDGRWSDAASIPVELMEAAGKLVGGK